MFAHVEHNLDMDTNEQISPGPICRTGKSGLSCPVCS